MAIETKKYLTLEGLTEYDSLIKSEIETGDASVKTYVDTELAKKANSSHDHNDIYYTETEIDQKLEGVNTSISNITSGTTPVKKAEEANHATSADSATDAEKLGGQSPDYYAKASDIPTGALASKDVVSESDLDDALAEKVNAASEGNHAHLNKEILDGITADKVSAWDNSLDLAKEYTDTKTSNMATTTVVENKISAHNASTEAHSDIRELITELGEKVNNFLDVDDTTTDQLSEVLTLINNNKGTLDSITSNKVNVSDIVDNLTTANASKVLSANQGVVLKGLIDALQEAVDGKAGSVHSHGISEVTGLQDALDAKATQTALDELTGVVNGKANATHSHAISEITNLQSTLDAKATNVTVNAHTGDTVKHITADERTAWNAIEGKAKTYTDEQVSGVSGTLTTHVNNTDIHFTAAERTKLAGIAENANRTVVDTALSSTSENPVANKVVNSAISDAVAAISANTQSINAHTQSITTIQAEIDSFEEITSAEIQALFNA